MANLDEFVEECTMAVPIGILVVGVAGFVKKMFDTEKLDEERQRRQQAEWRAEEEERRAEEERQRAEEERRRAVEEREYREALEQHMRDLGIDPADPDISPDDIEKAKRDIHYDPDTVNIAVAGNVNAGKSSLLNAIRNLNNSDPGWAPTGGSEVTMQRQRCPDPAHNCVWYDLPGAGTQRVTAGAFGYYYSQKLFAYDKVVLVHETTLIESDIRLLQVCKHFNQPCIVVRTKSDMHIYNYIRERRTPRRTPQEAREDFLSDVRQDVARFREQAEASRARFVPQFDDFVVSTAGIEAFVRGESS